MHVINFSRMRVVLVLCLLTGSISSVPVEKDLDSSGAESRRTVPWYKFRGTESSELGRGSSLPNSDRASGHTRGYTNFQVQRPPVTVQYVGTPGYVSQYPAAPAHVDSASGTSGEENEPVFSDVSNMAPTYSSSFRSRYQKGGAMMVQTRYVPTEAHGLSVPVFPYTSYMFAPQGYPYTPVKTAY